MKEIDKLKHIKSKWKDYLSKLNKEFNNKNNTISKKSSLFKENLINKKIYIKSKSNP